MASLIEILLRSNFDDSGFTEAEDRIQGMRRRMQDEEPSVQLPSDALTRNTEEARELAEAYRAAARSAEELGETDLAKKLNKEAKSIEGVVVQGKKLNRLTKSELIKNFTTFGASTKQMSAELKQAALVMKAMQAQATRFQKTALAETLRETAAGADQAAKELDDLEKALSKTSGKAQEAKSKWGQFADEFKDVQGVDQFNKKLKEIRKNLEQLQKTAKGEKLLDVSDSLRELEALEKRVLGAEAAFNQLGKPAKTLGKIIQSSFFQLGFAMFLLQNTLRNFTGIFNGIKTSLIDIGNAANRLRNFSNAMGDAGINVGSLNDKLREASGGYVKFATSQQQAMRLLNAGLPEVAAQADELVTLAKAAELASLGLFKAEEVYPLLIDAIIKGDAAALSAIPGLEGVASKLKVMEIRAKASGDELSLLEKRNVIIEEFGKAFDNLDTQALEDAADSTRNFSEELGQLKTSFGVAFGSLIDQLKEANEGTNSKLAGFFKGLLSPIRSARHAASNFMKALLGIGTIGNIVINELMGRFEELGARMKAIGGQFSNAWDALTSGDFSEFKNQMGGIADAAKAAGEQVTADVKDETKEWIETWRDATKEIDIALGLIPESAKEAIHDTNDALSGLVLNAGFDHSEKKAALEFFLSDERQFMLDSNEQWEDYDEAIRKINADAGEALTEIRQSALDDIADMEADFAKRQIKEAAKLVDKLVKIDDDSAFKIQRMTEDAEDKRNKIKEKSAKKQAKIEDDLAKKIRDINRRFDASRLKALIDRNARALFEAEQRRAEELRKARESAEEKKAAEKEARKEALNDLDADLAKRIAREQEDAQRRRDAAQKAHNDRMADLQAELDEEIAAREERRDDEIAAEGKAASKARIAAKKNLDDRLKDLADHYIERNRMAEAQRLLDEINELGQMDAMSEAAQDLHDEISTSFHDFAQDISSDIHDLVEAYKELEEIQNVTLPNLNLGNGGSDDDEPGSPTTGGGSTLPAGCDVMVDSLLEGASCSVHPQTTYCTKNGKKWNCLSGRWHMQTTGGFDEQGPDFFSDTQPDTLSPTTNTETTGTGGAVTINVNGDDTLERIFKEISYDAIIEVMT